MKQIDGDRSSCGVSVDYDWYPSNGVDQVELNAPNKIQLHHSPLTYEKLAAQKVKLQNRYASNDIEVPVKDYSNTQYFVKA